MMHSPNFFHGGRHLGKYARDTLRGFHVISWNFARNFRGSCWPNGHLRGISRNFARNVMAERTLKARLGLNAGVPRPVLCLRQLVVAGDAGWQWNGVQQLPQLGDLVDGRAEQAAGALWQRRRERHHRCQLGQQTLLAGRAAGQREVIGRARERLRRLEIQLTWSVRQAEVVC